MNVSSILARIGQAPGSIASQEIESFCKFSAFLKVIRYRSLEEEYQQPKTEQIGKETCLNFSSSWGVGLSYIH